MYKSYLNRFLAVLVCIIFITSVAGALNMPQGTKIVLKDLNSTIKLGNNYSFENLTVYGDKASFDSTNISINTQENKKLVFNMTSFNPSSSEPIEGKIKYFSKNSTNISINLSRLSSSADSYIIAIGDTEKEYSNGDISSRFTISGNSSVSISDSETSDSSGRNNNGGSSGGGSGGSSSSSGGGGFGGSLPQRTNNTENESNETQTDSVEVKFSTKSVDIRLDANESKSVEIGLRNEGTSPVAGKVSVENFMLSNRSETLENFSESSEYNFEVTGIKSGNFSGSVVFKYSQGKVSIPITAEVLTPEKQLIQSENLNSSGNKTKISIELGGNRSNGTLKTKVYNQQSEIVYSEERNIRSASKINSSIDLEEGSYRIERVVEYRDDSESYSKNFTVKKDHKNPETPHLSVLIILIIVCIVFYGLNQYRKNYRFQRIIKTKIKKVKKNRDSKFASEKFSKFIEEDTENAEDDNKRIKACKKQAKSALKKIESLDTVPDLVTKKVREAEENISNDDFDSLEKNLDKIEEIVDERIEEEHS